MGPTIQNGGFLEYVERYHGAYLATGPTNLAGGAADMGHYHMPFDVLLSGWYIIVTTAMDYPTIQPVVSIDVADYDGTSNRVEADEFEIPDNTLLGVTETRILAAAVAVARGRTIVLEHKTAGTGGGATGQAVVFPIWRATGNP
jgi:hypothetical protein